MCILSKNFHFFTFINSLYVSITSNTASIFFDTAPFDQAKMLFLNFQKILHKSGVFEAIDLTNSIYFSFSLFPYLMVHCGCLFLDIPPRLFILFFVVVAKHWWCSLVKQKAFSWPFLRSQSRGLCPMPIRVARSNFSRSAKHGTSYTGQNWWLYTRGGGKARGLCWMVIHYKEQYNKGPCIMWFFFVIIRNQN